jgi:hypothetical protein
MCSNNGLFSEGCVGVAPVVSLYILCVIYLRVHQPMVVGELVEPLAMMASATIRQSSDALFPLLLRSCIRMDTGSRYMLHAISISSWWDRGTILP